MAQLFKKNIIKEKLEDFKINNFEEKLEIVKKWHNDYHNWTLKTDNETARDSGWTQDFLWTVLDYTRKPADNYTYNTEYVVSGQRPDFVLWYFDKEENLVVWELKDAKTSLDAPQKREWSMTPIQQAFKYKWWLRNTSFVIVSNFYEIRLYNDNHLDFEIWNLDDLIDPKNDYFNFRKFYYLLCKDNLISKKWESNTKKLLSTLRIREKEITKKFYWEYTLLRKELFKDIIKNNPWFKKSELDFLLNKTQKIIDRIIFIHFCEDLNLLPNWKLKENILRAEEIGFKPWEMLQKFFEFINSGSEKLWIPDWYNGWLFKKDKELNNLKVWDKICKKFVDLWDYDFADDLSVNILWHIFEQSISDIEELKDKIRKDEEPTLSKRKKDWVFYTPEYIVDYIVKNSVWKKIEDWEEELKKEHKLKEDINDRNYTKRAILVYTELQEKVQNIKVLDPACGSGAFLVKVFDFLYDKNKEISKKLEDLWVNQWLFASESYFKTILQNNIFWVDLNEESVEITKLSLWLKTAIKWKKLANLDSNIKCWNSLIDDIEIAWDKAFNWEQEFSEIFQDWWFDVIVGNPPYGAKIDSISKNFLTKKFIKWWWETAISFIKLSEYLLNKEWFLYFIIPKSFSYASNYNAIREYIKDSLIEVVDCKKVWKEVKLEQVIFWIKKWENYNNSLSKILDKENFIEIWKINKDTIKTFWLFLNWISNIELLIWKKVRNVKTNLNNFVINRRWMILNKFIENWEIGVIGWAEISRLWIKKIRWYLDKNFIYEEKAKIINNSVLVQWIVAHIENPIPHIKITSCISDYLANNIIIADNINQLICNEWISNKFISIILNSNLINWYSYRFIYWNAIRTMRFDNPVTEKLPVPEIPLSEQKPFIEKADFMLENNKILQKKINKFLKRLNSNYPIDLGAPWGWKLSTKLKNFFELDFSEFVKELKKKKVVLSLKEQDEWEEYFEEYKKEIIELKAKIDNCDKEIDEMVFDLYGLDEEERKVVLGN